MVKLVLKTLLLAELLFNVPQFLIVPTDLRLLLIHLLIHLEARQHLLIDLVLESDALL